MGANDHRGWRGVTDNLHILLAVTYVPEGGILACHFNQGVDLVHVDVPEKCYQAIIHSPFGGSYYRKYVRSVYQCPFAEHPQQYRPTEKPSGKKIAPVKEKLDGPTPAQGSLFLLLEKKAAKRGKRSLNGGTNDTDRL
jgi:hypothetical protein